MTFHSIQVILYLYVNVSESSFSQSLIISIPVSGPVETIGLSMALVSKQGLGLRVSELQVQEHKTLRT